jgi:sugar lactone lactonase YvrE
MKMETTMTITTTRNLAAIALLTTMAATPAGAASVEVIAAGLDNPRGLGFAPNGELYVAEAGSGGSGNCRPSPDGMPADVCYGETGALTRIDPQGLQAPVRVLRNLPSMAAPGGFAAQSGPVDVDFFGMTAFVVMGWGGDPSLRAGVGPKGELFGTLLRTTPNGQYTAVSDVAGNELRHNPAGGRIDSNPYGGVALPGRRVVADAGANALIAFSASDKLDSVANHTLAVLPPTGFGTEPVPTTVVAGPDGYLYVGQLTGAPFFRGSSTIYRIPPQGGAAVPHVTGLTAVVDMSFARDGTLYVVEIASGLVPGPGADPGVGNGRLLRIPQGGAPEVVLAGLVFPAGVAIGPDNALYLTNFGIFPGGGQVLRITE